MSLIIYLLSNVAKLYIIYKMIIILFINCKNLLFIAAAGVVGSGIYKEKSW